MSAAAAGVVIVLELIKALVDEIRRSDDPEFAARRALEYVMRERAAREAARARINAGRKR